MWLIASTVFGFLAKMPWQAWAAIGLALAFLFVYHKGSTDGAAGVQAQWTAAAAQAAVASAQLASAANAAAQASVPALTPAQQASDAAIPPVAGRPKPCSVPAPFDRDCSK